MSWAFRIGPVMIAMGLTNLQPPDCLAQSLRLTGTVSDVNSRNKIMGATLYAQVDERRKKIAESGQEGTFRLEYPVAGNALVVEKTGYRTLVIPLAIQPAKQGDAPFFVPLPLIPLDQQATDKPYMQSEQKDFTLNTGKASQQKVTRVFKTLDALNGQTVHRATLCLQYTKIERKECHEMTQAAPAPRVTFGEADIVSVVVESPGYQTYRGNLILDTMDGSSSIYEIKMTPEITVLTMNITNASFENRYLLVSPAGDTISMRRGAGKSVYAFCPDGTYSLRVNTALGGQLYREVIQLGKGLNYRTLTLPPPGQRIVLPPSSPTKTTAPVVPMAVDAVPLADSVRMITLYFSQSDYDLQPEACRQLDKLVLLLRNIPNRNIRIEGHSDNVGSSAKNKTLSEYRARVTLKYLLDRGIAAGRMAWQGKGGSDPKASNESEETRKMNRRVEITIIPR